MIRYVLDAIHVDRGGGIVHLVNLVNNWPERDGNLVVFCKRTVKEATCKVVDCENVSFVHSRLIESGIIARYFYEYFILPNKIKKTDGLISLTGTFIGKRKYVSVSQNALLWQKKERLRYFPGAAYFRILLLRLIQILSFRMSSAVIVPTEFMYNQVLSQIYVKSRIVKLGSSNPIKGMNDNVQKVKSKISAVYVSSFDRYKHHEILVHYMSRYVRESGIGVDLLVVGDIVDQYSYDRFLKSLQISNSSLLSIEVRSGLNKDEMKEVYVNADVGCFMSTCENPSLVLLEMMSFNLPIIAVDTPNNKEVLGPKGRFFSLEVFEKFNTELTHILDNYINSKNDILVYSHLSSWKEFTQLYKQICDETMD